MCSWVSQSSHCSNQVAASIIQHHTSDFAFEKPGRCVTNWSKKMIIYSPTNPSPSVLDETGPTITALSASRQIEEMCAIPATTVKRKLIEALLTEKLYVRDEGGFKYKPEFLDTSVERIDIDDLNKYLAIENACINNDPKVSENDGVGSLPAAHHSQHQEIEALGTLPKKVQDARIEAILLVLRRQKLDPMCVPKGWKTRVKDECLNYPKLFSDSTFDSAWKEASKSRQLRADRHDQYIQGRH